MKTLTKTAQVLLLVQVLLLTPILLLYACKEEDHAETYTYKDTAEEVRIPRVEDINGKAVITWADPYITDMKEIKIKDLQTDIELTVAKGVQKAEFDITGQLLSYRYALKVVKTSGEITEGVIIRLVRNWAQQLHPVIDYNSSATAQSGMFFKNLPVAKVNVFDIREDENISKLTSSAMQGIINQEYAQSYLLWNDQHLDQLDDAGCNYELQPKGTTSKNQGFASLYNMYKDSFDCLVVWDENESWSWSLALMISAQQKGIPVTEYMKNFIETELGGTGSLQINDIRGNWSSKSAAYNWAIENLADNCHKKIIFSAGLRGDYPDSPWRMYDYTVACKGFCFWLDETNGDDKAIMNQIFDKIQYPVGSSVFGFGMNTIGDDLNKFTNIHNAGFVVSDYYANGSYWCSFPNKSFRQRKGIAGTVEPGKIYVAISLSDGDNVQFDQNSLYRIFKEGKRRGEVPMGVTMAAGLQELNPKLLEFYYKNLTQNDELTAGPSGFQFIYGDEYAQSGKYAEWIEMNSKWLATAGFHTAHLWNTVEQMYFKQYMEGSQVDLVMDGSDRTHTTGSSYKYLNNAVRIDQGTHCWNEGDVYRDLISISPSTRRPLFRHIYLLTDYYGFDGNKVVVYERLIKELQRVEEDSPNTFEYMLPMDLAATIKKYIDEGGIY